jgi:23S rRNA pseudouridine955/2504/2580 synthase
MNIQHRTVHAADAESRLDRWFRRHFPQLTQGALQKLLRTGQIRVDGKRAEGNTRLERGQEIRIPPIPEGPAPDSAPKPREITRDDAQALERMILYKDDSVIALDKPHGLAVQGGPNIKKHLDGMLDALRFGHDERPRLVHRLDRDTSGVILVARDGRAASRLAAAFRSRDAEKTYWAIVVGQPEYEGGRIDMPLTKQGGGPMGERTVPAEGKEGTFAVTEYSTMDVARRHATWLELRPLTGRTHQLRVHCASALACPILGDGKYGGQAAHLEGMSNSLHLHARRIVIPHPEGGTLEVTAPLSPHMLESFATLGFDKPRNAAPKRIA